MGFASEIESKWHGFYERKDAEALGSLLGHIMAQKSLSAEELVDSGFYDDLMAALSKFSDFFLMTGFIPQKT
ncbi:hypothetical protein [Halomonas sp. E19]|uniref:hypothetical protein n=1 Tax=Halomonas sp. E19 TaxID=3397247 RepID=UPI004033B194